MYQKKFNGCKKRHIGLNEYATQLLNENAMKNSNN